MITEWQGLGERGQGAPTHYPEALLRVHNAAVLAAATVIAELCASELCAAAAGCCRGCDARRTCGLC